MAPVTGELLQRPSFKGKERELLLFGAVLNILDKVLGVFVVWQGKHVRTHLFLSSHLNCVRRAGFRFYRHLISSVNFNHSYHFLFTLTRGIKCTSHALHGIACNCTVTTTPPVSWKGHTATGDNANCARRGDRDNVDLRQAPCDECCRRKESRQRARHYKHGLLNLCQ